MAGERRAELLKVVTWILILFFCWFGGVKKSEAIEKTIFNRPLEVHGFLSQQAAFCYADGEDLSNVSDYTHLEIETTYAFSDTLSVYTLFHFIGDWVYDIRNDSSGFSRYMAGRDNMQFNTDMYDRAGELINQAYLRYQTPSLELRLGKQAVAWGESDGIRLMDQINPLDIRRDFVMWDFKDIEVPIWMLRAQYFPEIQLGKLSDVALEFIWIPGDIKETRMGLNSEGVVSGLPQVGIWGAPQPNLPPSILEAPLTLNKRASTLKNSEFGFRFMGTIESCNFTLNFFNGFSDDFVVKYRGLDVLGPGGGDIISIPPTPSFPGGLDMLNFLDQALVNAGLGLRANLAGEYMRYKLAGLTLSREVEFIKWKTVSPVLRVEALYSFDQAFNTDGKSKGDLAWLSSNGVVKKDMIRYMVGFDWPMWLKWLNWRQTFFVSCQFFQFIILDYDEELVNLPYYFDRDMNRDPWRVHKEQNYATFLVNTGYDFGRILPEFMICNDFQEDCYFIKAKVIFAYGDHWRPEFGVHHFEGNNNTNKSFGMYDGRDQIYCKVKYQF